MQKADRKAAVAAYKERAPDWGVFAVRCTPTGQLWVGGSRQLDAQRNRIWFALRQGDRTRPDLQAAWTAHGEAAFTLETLESLSPDLSPMARADALKQRTAHWRAELGAGVV